ELNQMYWNLQMEGVGSFSNAKYWSSSEYGAISPWTQDFGSGSQSPTSTAKDASTVFRHVRCF
ncbi:MAG TPA: hypothetical protein VKS21_03160, partial [Spirochaetota bacterium]|nr:hypothetical protein [Spirochaetota bacterium]